MSTLHVRNMERVDEISVEPIALWPTEPNFWAYLAHLTVSPWFTDQASTRCTDTICDLDDFTTVNVIGFDDTGFLILPVHGTCHLVRSTTLWSLYNFPFWNYANFVFYSLVNFCTCMRYLWPCYLKIGPQVTLDVYIERPFYQIWRMYCFSFFIQTQARDRRTEKQIDEQQYTTISCERFHWSPATMCTFLCQ